MIERPKRSRIGASVLGAIGCGVFLVLMAGCSQLAITPAITYQGNVFQITATTGYAGDLVTDLSTTAISGSSSQDITVSASAGQQYTLTLWKTASDGAPLKLQLLVEETINGTPTTVVADSQTTTNPNVPVRVVLLP